MRSCEYVGNDVAGLVPATYRSDRVLGRRPHDDRVHASSVPSEAHRGRGPFLDDAGLVRDRGWAVVSVWIAEDVRPTHDRERINGPTDSGAPGCKGAARDAGSPGKWFGASLSLKLSSLSLALGNRAARLVGES